MHDTRETSFVVRGTPVPQGSMKGFPIRRANGSIGATVTSDNKKTRPWKDSVRWAAAQAWQGAPSEDAIALTLEFAFIPPKSNRYRYKTTKPDIDKLERAVLDAMTGVVYRDDAQVIAVTKRKVFTLDSPQLVVRVETIANEKVTAKEARAMTFARRSA